MRQLLLSLHVLAGIVSLAAALLAISARLFGLPHRWHVVGGRVFTLGMLGIAFTVFPLAGYFKPNLFLLLLGVFSFYLAVSGWRYATARGRGPKFYDWATAGGMFAASALMLSYSLWLVSHGATLGWALLMFAVIGATLSALDWRALRRGGLQGRERIAQHLTMMLGGTAAALTAALVTQVHIEPKLLLWIGPTAVIVPLIVHWRRSMRHNPAELPR